MCWQREAAGAGAIRVVPRDGRAGRDQCCASARGRGSDEKSPGCCTNVRRSQANCSTASSEKNQLCAQSERQLCTLLFMSCVL